MEIKMQEKSTRDFGDDDKKEWPGGRVKSTRSLTPGHGEGNISSAFHIS